MADTQRASPRRRIRLTQDAMTKHTQVIRNTGGPLVTFGDGYRGTAPETRTIFPALWSYEHNNSLRNGRLNLSCCIDLNDSAPRTHKLRSVVKCGHVRQQHSW